MAHRAPGRGRVEGTPCRVRQGVTVGRHIDSVMAAIGEGRIVGERAVAAMAAKAIEADRAEREGRPVRASAPVADPELTDDEWASLWPPVTAAEADRRERIVASACPDLSDDDDLYRALFGDQTWAPR